VLRLTQLVARQDANLEEIAAVIAKDPALRARLLRLANPDVEREEDYAIQTVEEAILRNGMGCALLLAMSTPLALALAKTFQTMLGLKLDTLDYYKAAPVDSEHVLGTIAFSGKALGSVCLRLDISSAVLIASRILGLDGKVPNEPNEINDAVGELLNIMTGNFKSNLCDAGLDCRLEPPAVTRVPQFDLTSSRGNLVERMAFHAPNAQVFVDVTVNPWNQE
jgi:chemotaxis protein CheX